MKRPRCEGKGTLPHPATNALTWELQSGRVTKFFCDDHSENVSPQPYFVSKLIGYYERNTTAAPPGVDSALAADTVEVF